MKVEMKELIDEFIDYRKNRKPLKYLKNSYEKLGDNEFVGLIGWLLQWQKETTLGWKSIEKFEISAVLHKRYKVFFKECPELEKVFKLNNDYIGWADGISESEKIEIRDYIHNNYTIQVRVRQTKK